MKMSPHQNFGKTQTTPVPESVAFELGSMGSRSRVFGRPTRTCGELIAYRRPGSFSQSPVLLRRIRRRLDPVPRDVDRRLVSALVPRERGPSS